MNEVIETAAENLPMIADDQLVSIVAQAEKRIEAFNKLKGLALRLTNAQDWVDQGGRPYMQSSAAEKIGSFFGVSWHIDEPTIEKEESGHFTYTYQGVFTWRGNSITAIGTRSSKDGFFKKYGYKDNQREELPPSEIDKGDVKKSAYTNCIGNGVTRSLGIRNLTWVDIEQEAGITKDAVMSVDYKKKGKAQEKIASEGANSIEAFITDIRVQTKTKDGKTMKNPLYKINAEGKEYKTFSETIAATAKEAKEAKRKVKITFTTNQYGNDAESIIFVPDEPKEEGWNDGEREPGQEG